MAERRARGFSNIGEGAEFKPAVIEKRKQPAKKSVQAASMYISMKQQPKQDAVPAEKSGAATILKRSSSNVRMVRQCENCKTLFENAHVCKKIIGFAKKLNTPPLPYNNSIVANVANKLEQHAKI